MSLQQLIVLGLQLSILLTVFGFGLQATLDDMLYVIRRPSLLVRSLVAMFVIMPIVALAITEIFALRPVVEIVLVALAISPVPPLLPRTERSAGGQAAYALGFLAVAGLLALVFVPFGVSLIGRFLGRSFAVPLADVARIVLISVLVPLAAGLLLRHWQPRLAARLAKPVSIVATVLLVIGGLTIFVAAVPASLSLIGSGTLAAMTGFVVIGLAVGHVLAAPRADEQTVLAISTACRHPAIALAIAKANFPDEPYLGGAIVLSLLVSAIICLPYIAWRKRLA